MCPIRNMIKTDGIVAVLSQNDVVVSSSILLPPERYSKSRNQGAAFWLRLEISGYEVEGILHLPERGEREKLIIFEPGFPGDGSTRLERYHLTGLLDNGYSVFTTRHNGTIINGKYSDNYINCPEKQNEAKLSNQEYLGNNKQYTIMEWLTEPLVSIKSLSSLFSDIYLIGHSFGSLAIFSSLIALTQSNFVEINRIRRVISLSGATGRVRSNDDPIIEQWRRYLDTDWTRERVIVGDVEANLDHLRTAYVVLHREGVIIPEWIDLIYINPWGDNIENLDELVSPLEAIDIVATMGRGSLIIDKTQFGDRNGRMVHDMDNLKTSSLLDLLQGKITSSNSLIAVLK